MNLGQGLGLPLKSRSRSRSSSNQVMRIRFGPHQWRLCSLPDHIFLHLLLAALFLSAYVLLLLVFVAASASPVSDSIIPRMVGADTNSQPQLQSGQEQKVDCRETLVQREVGRELVKPQRQMSVGMRRFLSRPGSSPPRCISKCGSCRPCIAVDVPVPPGTPTSQEYYPEAWRCKCGNKLYMP